MRHRRLRRKLGVKSPHRRALLRNLIRSLAARRRIRTTMARAREAGAFADSMVQLAKKGDLHARRQLISRLACPRTADLLIKEIAPRFKDRQGGYTRVLRLNPRPGDGAEMAILEFSVSIPFPEKKTTDKKKKKAKAAPEPKAAEKAKGTEEAQEKKGDKKESEKKGGFLSGLRRFLKGDDAS